MDSQESSPTSQLENINSSALSFLYSCLYRLMSFTYFAPPLTPSPLANISLFFVSLSLFQFSPTFCWPSCWTYYAAATAAKSLQSCPTLCDPIDGSPPGSPVPGILQARMREWVAISFSNAWKWRVKVKLLSRVRLLATPWTYYNKPIIQAQIFYSSASLHSL